MLALTLTSLLALSANDVLSRVQLYTVRADGGSCGLLPEADRPLFRSWRLDPDRTIEERGIFGLYNPERPDQLVLFFADEDTCKDALELLVEPSPLELEPEPTPVARVAPTRGNPRDITAEEALSDAEGLGLFPERSLWCACTIDRESMRCEDDGSRIDVAFAPVVPVREFGPTFAAWHDGAPACVRRGRSFSGRRCAAQIDPLFRRMVSDLYNLAPQEIRSSYMERDLRAPLGERCETDSRRSRLRPSKVHRGTIARIYLYMAQSYPEHVTIDPALLNVLERWNREAPPSEDECQRGARVTELQGNRNAVLQAACVGK